MLDQEKQDNQEKQALEDAMYEGRDEYFMDIDRMVDGGLGSGYVSDHNGLIEETTTDTMLEQDTYKD